MVPCSVDIELCAYIVTFDGVFGRPGKTILLQSDYDQAAFAVNCGLLKPPDDWDGCPSTLDGWEDADLTDIDKCPEEYLDVAE